ncbi:sugar ABC transporter permease [Ktedonobacter sp. SOSP1-52]|uniref:carbohydrate ABC transporter permease n=1 Tax=Ktedonobacter sp. SOSP1-52 TaxID=2778366 RepID=UPI001915D9FD|nr:carbohydrate ABC transporter permease [Ktedonobacter sp. SOSP1-52]GHO68137.1 sugar ABC transporter permease [Ktedonobacter sp. SOSP1-52]
MIQEDASGKRVNLQAAKARTQRTSPIKVGSIVIHLLLILGAILMAAPFLWMILTSLKTATQAFSVPPTWIPNPVAWQNYPDSLQALPFGLAYFNSIYICFVVVASQLLTCSMAGYAFARIRFPLRGPLFILFLATLMIPLQVTIIPLFLVMKQLGWIDTHLSIIVPYALLNAFGVFLMRQFIKGIPIELEEAAIMDGANRWTLFWRVILPLLKAPLAALGIISFLSQWNNFFAPLIMLSNSNLYTVPLMLNLFKGEYTTSWTLLMAGSALAVLPILLVYIIAQRHIIQGIQLTGLKG